MLDIQTQGKGGNNIYNTIYNYIHLSRVKHDTTIFMYLYSISKTYKYKERGIYTICNYVHVFLFHNYAINTNTIKRRYI